MILCLSEWTQAGFGFFVTNEYGRGGERRLAKTEGLSPEHANPTLLTDWKPKPALPA